MSCAQSISMSVSVWGWVGPASAFARECVSGFEQLGREPGAPAPSARAWSRCQAAAWSAWTARPSCGSPPSHISRHRALPSPRVPSFPFLCLFCPSETRLRGTSGRSRPPSGLEKTMASSTQKNLRKASFRAIRKRTWRRDGHQYSVDETPVQKAEIPPADSQSPLREAHRDENVTQHRYDRRRSHGSGTRDWMCSAVQTAA